MPQAIDGGAIAVNSTPQQIGGGAMTSVTIRNASPSNSVWVLPKSNVSSLTGFEIPAGVVQGFEGAGNWASTWYIVSAAGQTADARWFGVYTV